MRKKQQEELIRSIIKEDEKDGLYSEVAVCDHKWHEPNGCSGTYRNVCEKCGKDMRTN
jgi:hypothetical protein